MRFAAVAVIRRFILKDISISTSCVFCFTPADLFCCQTVLNLSFSDCPLTDALLAALLPHLSAFHPLKLTMVVCSALGCEWFMCLTVAWWAEKAVTLEKALFSFAMWVLVLSMCECDATKPSLSFQHLLMMVVLNRRWMEIKLLNVKPPVAL